MVLADSCPVVRERGWLGRDPVELAADDRFGHLVDDGVGLQEFLIGPLGREELRVIQLGWEGQEAELDVTVDAEVEDAQGNVYNTKTYEDLRRQGLI